MNEKKDILMRNRSAGSCIKYGYNLYFGNFKKLFKASLLMALLYAIVCGVLGVMMAIYAPKMLISAPETQLGDSMTEISTTAGGESHTFIMFIIGLLIVIGGFFEIMTYLKAFMFLRNHKSNEDFVSSFLWRKDILPVAFRTLKGIVFTLLIVAIPIILFVIAYKYVLYDFFENPSDHVLTFCLTLFTLFLVVTFLLPLTFPMMKYIMEDKGSYLTILKNGYKSGMFYWGLLFVVFFINAIILAVAGYVIELPAVVISMANYTAYFGQLIGDPLGLPSYILPLTAVVFFFAGVIQIFLRMAVIFTLYYVYGTIEVREEGRRQSIQKDYLVR